MTWNILFSGIHPAKDSGIWEWTNKRYHRGWERMVMEGMVHGWRSCSWLQLSKVDTVVQDWPQLSKVDHGCPQLWKVDHSCPGLITVVQGWQQLTTVVQCWPWLSTVVRSCPRLITVDHSWPRSLWVVWHARGLLDDVRKIENLFHASGILNIQCWYPCFYRPVWKKIMS